MPRFEQSSGVAPEANNVTTSQLLLESAQQPSVLGDFGRSFAHSLVQAPVEGVAQLIDGKSNGDARKAVHFMDAAQHADFASGRWFAQQAGTALGAVPWVLAVHKGVSGAMNRSFSMKAGLAMADHTTALTARQALGAGGLKAFESGLTGAIYSGVLSPVRADEQNFWEARARNGAVGMLAFGTLAGSGVGLKHLSESSRLAMPTLSRVAGSEISAAMISGIPAGLVAANADSLLQGKGFATAKQNFESAAGFSILGGGFAFGKAKLSDLGSESSRANQVAPESFNKAGLDVDGRPVAENVRAQVAAKLPDYAQGDMTRARTQALRDMAEIKGSNPGQSVFDQFRNSNLSTSQKYRVLSSLAEVREHFVKQRVNGQLDPDQAGNWIHTQGEFGRVEASTRAANLNPAATEDALLGSMFADAVKTKANFHVHHMDGALAADHVLGKYMGDGFTRSRLDNVVHAVREHQIGPPDFMAQVMYGGKIKGVLEAKQGAPLSAEQTATLNGLKAKITDPLNPNVEKVRTADGGTALKLTPEERAMLELTGVREWYVPDAGNRWNAQSRAVINGDTLDNYFTPGGTGKIASLGGPESDIFFKNRRIDGDAMSTDRTTNIGSSRNSSFDAGSLLTPEVKALAEQATAAREAAIAQAKAQTAEWLKTQGIDPAKTEVPFFNADLKYPNFNGNKALEADWWSIHRTPADKRTATQQALYDQHRYIGLSEPEVAAFQRAKEIRSQVVSSLRAQQRVDGQAPPDYKPATRN